MGTIQDPAIEPTPRVLDRSVEMYEAMLETPTDRIFLIDSDYRFVYLNASAVQSSQAVLGLEKPRSAFIGRSIDELGFPALFRRVFKVEIDKAFLGEPVIAEFTLLALDGTPVAFEYSMNLMRENVGPPGVIGIARDLSRRMQAGLVGQEMLLSEQLARAEAEAAVRIRNDFLSNAAHDLKSPLTAAQGRAQMLRRQLRQEGPLDADRLRVNVDAIQAAITQMANQIAELQDLAFLQIDRLLELNTETSDLTVLVQECIERATRDEETAPGIALIRDTDPIVAVFDRVRMARVVDNLISNAFKYTGLDRDIQVAVLYDATSEPLRARLDIVDNGIGIPAHDLPNIFEYFVRAANVGAIGGTGIGLSGARQIVRQHGGELVAESVEGEGSRFTLWLPCE